MLVRKLEEREREREGEIFHLDGLVGPRVEVLPGDHECSDPVVLCGQFLHQFLGLYVPDLQQPGQETTHSQVRRQHTNE